MVVVVPSLESPTTTTRSTAAASKPTAAGVLRPVPCNAVEEVDCAFCEQVTCSDPLGKYCDDTTVPAPHARRALASLRTGSTTCADTLFDKLSNNIPADNSANNLTIPKTTPVIAYADNR